MGSITRPYTYTPGNTITAAQNESNETTIYNEFNGNIDNANIKSSAAIVESKIAFDTSAGHSHDGVDSKLIQVNRGFGFFYSGTPTVADDISWNPIAPQAVTAVKTWAKCKVAPTGAALIARIYNITQAAVVGTVTIADGATTGNSTTYTTPAVAAGDVLRMDITQIGSTVAGADITIILETSQP